MRIGVIGGGQLGRMLGLAGIPLGLHFRFLEPSAACPAAACGEVIPTAYDDPDGLERFVQGLSVATYEFESVPASSAQWLASRIPLEPSPRALEIAQDRIAEKTAFRALGIPVARFAAVGTVAEVTDAAKSIGAPCVLKTRRLGYDGKGQRVIRGGSSGDLAPQIAAAWEELGRVPCILEELVEFTAEVSMIAVRGRGAGHTRSSAYYALTENVHRDGILWRSTAPAPCDPSGELDRMARAHVSALMESLDYHGVIGVEFFVTRAGLLANEMAPRVHNSGHWTIDGALTSQFENHLRAISGLPLGPTAARGACAMINLVGRTPLPSEILGVPGARLHLYGKPPRKGRKVGHVTLCAEDQAQLALVLRALEERVAWE
ncbi:MAG: 5-(carboxyamino)imidazole ribonucleotide synthase [Phycisphaerales bacterium]|nr:5-(carboxyamino)imidazole ribonucleotide synthase [Phycisphaerales bacterium]